jgi:hypothetical protein
MARKGEALNDWRSQFQQSPTLFLAAAIGGGLLIGIATNARKSHPAPQRQRETEPQSSPRSLDWDWSDSIGVIKSILIGIAITQAKKVLIIHMANQRATTAEESERQAPTSGRAKAPPDSTTH